MSVTTSRLLGVIKLPAGFDFAPILQYGSARPYDITSPVDNLGFGNGSANYGVLVPVNDQKNYTYSLTSGMTKAQLREAYFAGQLTTAKFDALRGDPTFNLDARLAKNIKFRERLNLQLIAQAFDLTNRANYGL